jgi:hypothetical protein
MITQDRLPFRLRGRHREGARESAGKAGEIRSLLDAGNHDVIDRRCQPVFASHHRPCGIFSTVQIAILPSGRTGSFWNVDRGGLFQKVQGQMLQYRLLVPKDRKQGWLQITCGVELASAPVCVARASAFEALCALMSADSQ